MINTKRPSTDDYTQVGFVEAKDTQGNYQNIDHIYDAQGNIVFQQGYLNEYQGADDFSIPAIGKPLLDYTIYGNTVQRGTPSSDSPIMPQGTGERTGNILNPAIIENGYGVNNNGEVVPTSTRVANTTPIDISGIDYLTITYQSATANFLYAIISNGTMVERTTSKKSGDVIDCRNGDKLNVCWYQQGTATKENLGNIMFNVGETALPYEPWGYEIPISSANTTTPVYLGEVETTRKVKKLVFDGSEPWVLSGNTIYINNTDTERLSPLMCTHFPNVQNTGMWNGNNWIFQVNISNLGMTGRDAWITYLQQQYANGTPVTVWYVLATPTTGIVNEPLMKIGDYADTLSMEQAGVQIPTLNKPNNTVIDVETEVEPSEIDVVYRGSTKPKYNLFLAQNGDSFEAKDGQSLYIGGGL